MSRKSTRKTEPTMRTVVYQYETRNGMFIGTNLNDELRMEPCDSLTLQHYLNTLELADELSVVAIEGDEYTFSNGTTEILQEREEDIDLARYLLLVD